MMLTHFDGAGWTGVSLLMERYCELLDKNRQQAKFVLEVMNRNREKLSQIQFIVMVTLISTPVACMMSSKGIIDHNLQEFLRFFKFTVSLCLI